MATLLKFDPTAPYPMMVDGQKVRNVREIEVILRATGKVFATAARADQAVLDAAFRHKLADSLQDHADTGQYGICINYNPNPRRLPWPHI